MSEVCQLTDTWMLDPRTVEAAILSIGRELAADMELCSDPSEGYDPEPTTWDIAEAMRQPVSLGTAFYDLCRLLKVEPPYAVLEAVGKRPLSAFAPEPW